ncbi:MAG: tRNA (adenosine(37)-N6)-threonylcarbamoyltransferase complex ATPase subunit type 1 TsaE [Bryobacterales bacterium]|nr:tRNA (adenosine(37)-N6)-threonylcarbamoyltransferase complex ATPase subunit type 1 TsaE [Bryobacterales bacterium]
MIYRARSAAETSGVGAKVAAMLQAPAVVMLIGDLGAGKTTLAKGIVQALGVAPPEEVLSPTFSLVHEYEGPPKVYHLDLYRLDTLPELETLGLEDIWEERAVVLIEWGERFSSELPGERIEVRLDYDGDDGRVIEVRAAASPGQPRLSESI